MRYIPKIIHLIWFGNNPYPLIVQKCMDSWKKYCNEYEIKLWNENTFDIDSNTFVKEAYKAKKWAFVSDYVRLYALYHYGGVYIDSDVEILQSFEELLEDEHVVTGYSAKCWLTTGFIAAEKGNKWIKMLIEYYTGRHFVLPDGTYDMKPNNAIITELSKSKAAFKVGDSLISYGNVRLYPRIFFHPYQKQIFEFNEENIKNIDRFFNIDEKNTYCVHYSMGSWSEERHTLFSKFKHWIRKIAPQPIIEWLESIYYKKYTYLDI